MKYSTLLLSVLLLALLAVCVMGKAHNHFKMSARLSKEKTETPVKKVAEVEVAKVAEERDVPIAEERYGGGEHEKERLDTCLDELKNNTRLESELEERRDSCLAELAPLIEEDKHYELKRDRNHTLAIRCLLEVTECNDAHDAQVVSSGKRSYDESLINLPTSAQEADQRREIPALDQEKYDLMKANPAKRERRETFRCTLDRCYELVSESNFKIEELQKEVTWCENEIVRRKWSIVTYRRFSTLYEEETARCEPIAHKCRSGMRLVRVTLTNGNYEAASFVTAFQPGWVGFGNQSGNPFFTNGQDSEELRALRNGSTGPLFSSLEETVTGAVASDLGESVLGFAQSWSVDLELNPEVNSFGFYAFPFFEAPTGSAPDPGQMAVPSLGVQLFNDGDFISTVPRRRPGKRSTTKSKRGPHAKDIAGCGCRGDPLPYNDRHVFEESLEEVATYDGSAWYNSTISPAFAVLTFEELRWTVPFAVGIPPSVL